MKDYFKYVVQLKDDFYLNDYGHPGSAEDVASIGDDWFDRIVNSTHIRNFMAQVTHAIDFLENSDLNIKGYEFLDLPSFFHSDDEIDTDYILVVYTENKETFVFINIDIVPDSNVKVKWEYDEFFNKYLDNKLDKEFFNETL